MFVPRDFLVQLQIARDPGHTQAEPYTFVRSGPLRNAAYVGEHGNVSPRDEAVSENTLSATVSFFVTAWSYEDESWRELQLSLAFDRQLSSTLIDFELVQILMRFDESLCAIDQS